MISKSEPHFQGFRLSRLHALLDPKRHEVYQSGNLKFPWFQNRNHIFKVSALVDFMPFWIQKGMKSIKAETLKFPWFQNRNHIFKVSALVDFMPFWIQKGMKSIKAETDCFRNNWNTFCNYYDLIWIIAFGTKLMPSKWKVPENPRTPKTVTLSPAFRDITALGFSTCQIFFLSLFR